MIYWSGTYGHLMYPYMVSISSTYYTSMRFVNLSIDIPFILTVAREANVTKNDGGGDWQYICSCAISKLEEVCIKICNGDICMHDLRLLDKRKGQMHKLCLATTVDGKPQSGMPSADVVITNLERRLKEYEQFEEYQRQLNNILFYFTSVRLEGISFSMNC